MIKNKKIGFIGVGNMGQAMIKALVDSGTVLGSQIYASNRTPGKLKKVEELYGVQTLPTNEQVVDASDIIVISVKPQDLALAIEPISSSFHSGHLVVSIAAGFSLKSLKKLLPEVQAIARAMPNTPATIRKAVVGYCLAQGSEIYEGTVEDLLNPLGYVVQVQEGDLFESLTVSCGSGPGFILEIMQYWQEWLEEHGFESPVARRMVVETFVGTSLMAQSSSDTTLIELQERVVSKKGVTAAGLDSMRELELERALRFSFEKAVLRDREIERNTAKS